MARNPEITGDTRMISAIKKFSLTRRWLAGGLAALALGAIGSTAAHAQDAVASYPTRPVTLVVPFPPGGVTDATFRKIGERFTAITGQNMIIHNRAGRTNALSALANAEPDGYTLSLVGRSQMITYWLLGDAMPFDPIKDFTWIDSLVSSWFGLFVNADSPYKTVDDLLAAARADSKAIRYGTAFGVGGLTHAPMHDFAKQNNVEMLHVPFKGDSEALRALMGKEVEAVVAAGSGMPYVDSGRLRLLAWVSAEPHPKYPDVKTLKQLGHDTEAYSIVGLGGPKGMDPALAKKISDIFQQILKEPETEAYMLGVFQNPSTTGPEAFHKWAVEQLDKERATLDEFGLLPESKPTSKP